MLPNAIPASPAAWTLVSQHGPLDSVAPLPLTPLPCKVGCRPGSALLLADPSVSSHHAEFFEKEARLYLRDFGSTNGTYVNGRRVDGERSLNDGDLVQFAQLVFRLRHEVLSQTFATCCTSSESLSDWAFTLSLFDKLMSERAVVPFYQPIVLADGEPYAYEALGRSRLFGLDLPSSMFRAASQLNQEAALSQLLRVESLQATLGSRLRERVPGESRQSHLFLNTHPAELKDLPRLILSLRELRKAYPHQPLTLEIHESAIAETMTMKMLRLALTDLNMKLAYDDFGVGQARLVELAETSPDFVKFDMKLIRGIHQATRRQQQLLGTLVKLVADLGVVPLAEGVECADEAEVCRNLGFRLFQGYYYGRPGAAQKYLRQADGAH